MLSLNRGNPIAFIVDKDGYEEGVLHLLVDDNARSTARDKLTKQFMTYDKLVPILNEQDREISYIAGPSGSGKSTLAATLTKEWMDKHPKRDVYFFSRTNYVDDPAYKDLKMFQIKIDESMINDPIDITSEITEEALCIFDDVTTIQEKALKEKVELLMSDIMEVGRKLRIWIIITSHLINPNDKKLGRTIMNEMQSLYIFPQGGSSYQINFALSKYIGLSKKEINKIMEIPSRWVKISKIYPQYVMYDKGGYLIN